MSCLLKFLFLFVCFVLRLLVVESFISSIEISFVNVYFSVVSSKKLKEGKIKIIQIRKLDVGHSGGSRGLLDLM